MHLNTVIEATQQSESSVLDSSLVHQRAPLLDSKRRWKHHTSDRQCIKEARNPNASKKVAEDDPRKLQCFYRFYKMQQTDVFASAIEMAVCQ
jgi:hypothetical protein